MVTFELAECKGNILTYQYWPEDDKSAIPGIIEVDLDKETGALIEPAEKDFECSTTGREMNELRESINRTREEDGRPPLTEEELQTEPNDAVYRWWQYYDKVISHLSDAHDEGKILESGQVAWY